MLIYQATKNATESILPFYFIGIDEKIFEK